MLYKNNNIGQAVLLHWSAVVIIESKSNAIVVGSRTYFGQPYFPIIKMEPHY